jgi:hypothetical protein
MKIKILFICIIVILTLGTLIVSSKNQKQIIELPKFTKLETTNIANNTTNKDIINTHTTYIEDEPFVGMSFYPNDADEWVLYQMKILWSSTASQELKDNKVVIAYDFPSQKARDELKGFTLIMPCGESYTFNSVEDIPKTTTKCRCGNPNHYIVKINNTENTNE